MGFYREIIPFYGARFHPDHPAMGITEIFGDGFQLGPRLGATHLVLKK